MKHAAEAGKHERQPEIVALPQDPERLERCQEAASGGSRTASTPARFSASVGPP